jgi:hypothetical protein
VFASQMSHELQPLIRDYRSTTGGPTAEFNLRYTDASGRRLKLLRVRSRKVEDDLMTVTGVEIETLEPAA